MSFEESQRGGGGINNSGSLVLIDTAVTGNTAGFFGGGIINHGSGTLDMTAGPVSNNTTGMEGGGINNGGTLTLLRSDLTNNIAEDSGAVLHH